MGMEIEIKLRLSNPQTLRERLAACGATHAGRAYEVNTIFDTPGGSLRSADCALRVRRLRPLAVTDWPAAASTGGEPPSAWLTFKGPRKVGGRTAGAGKPTRSSGRPRTREELETHVDNADTLLAILLRIGLIERVIYEKRREIWRLDGCEVALDELPVLGAFVEIEGPDERAVQAVQAKLGLERAESVDATYVELAHRHGSERSDGVRELRF
jgi:adenylate cyclase class 2